jgi:hypothetical protein
VCVAVVRATRSVPIGVPERRVAFTHVRERRHISHFHWCVLPGAGTYCSSVSVAIGERRF